MVGGCYTFVHFVWVRCGGSTGTNYQLVLECQIASKTWRNSHIALSNRIRDIQASSFVFLWDRSLFTASACSQPLIVELESKGPPELCLNGAASLERPKSGRASRWVINQQLVWTLETRSWLPGPEPPRHAPFYLSKCKLVNPCCQCSLRCSTAHLCTIDYSKIWILNVSKLLNSEFGNAKKTCERSYGDHETYNKNKNVSLHTQRIKQCCVIVLLL